MFKIWGPSCLAKMPRKIMNNEIGSVESQRLSSHPRIAVSHSTQSKLSMEFMPEEIYNKILFVYNNKNVRYD